MSQQTRYERFGLTVPKCAIDGKSKTFVEAGVVKHNQNGKLGDHGVKWYLLIVQIIILVIATACSTHRQEK